MRGRNIPIQYLGSPEERRKWEKRCEEERRKNQAATRAYRARQRTERQLELELGLPKLILCPGCHGLGCKNCKKTGVVEASEHKVSPPTTPVVKSTENSLECNSTIPEKASEHKVTPKIESTPVDRGIKCPRCWGVGQIASHSSYAIRQCPDCLGSGKSQ